MKQKVVSSVSVKWGMEERHVQFVTAANRTFVRMARSALSMTVDLSASVHRGTKDLTVMKLTIVGLIHANTEEIVWRLKMDTSVTARHSIKEHVVKI